jgi:glycosyltransferase involved in cell wall biosynthesis
MKQISQKRDLIIVPFHDWRKSEREGFRTRDVHFINALAKHPAIGKILVVNRPSTWLELRVKKFDKDLQGDKILSRGSFELTKVADNIFVSDFMSGRFVQQILLRNRWFFKMYAHEPYVQFIKESAQKLGFSAPGVLIQNIFAFRLASELPAGNKLFDAWDNFLKFPAYKGFTKDLDYAYSQLAIHTPHWITNSLENKNLFLQEYSPKKISVIKNGVKANFVSKNSSVPHDMKDIPRPIAGFGGKISYLLNTELINQAALENPGISFVFVGQILDKETFNKIEKTPNVYFLGDKHYEEYPNYVNSFDICIVPYRIGKDQHGGDSLKVYEYLLTGKKVIGTNGNGLQDLTDYAYVVESAAEFSRELQDRRNNKPLVNPEEHSWEKKAGLIVATLFE